MCVSDAKALAQRLITALFQSPNLETRMEERMKRWESDGEVCMCVLVGGGQPGSWGVGGEPIANICWLAGSGEMDCSGTLSERQFHHRLCGPVHLVFLEHWGDLLVRGGGGVGGWGVVEETRVAIGNAWLHFLKPTLSVGFKQVESH